MNNKLFVWIYPGKEAHPILCGELLLLQGRKCIFSYDKSWLIHPNSFELSPDIPLRSGIHKPSGELDIHPIFEDAMPDKWGKKVINKFFNPQRRSYFEYLELAGENRIGALGFSNSDSEYKIGDQDLQVFNVDNIERIVSATELLVANMPIDNHMRKFLRPGSSAGGARPKAIIKYDNADWIAKFPMGDDEYDVSAIEHASLVLAKQCGIEVAESKLLKVGKQNILLVKRFDRHNQERIHFASARTMLLATGVKEEEMSYADIAAIIRKYSSSPKNDCHEIFRRMVFNVLIENTDDHEKNHAFLFKDGAWKLSPAYDILPQLQGLGFQQLRIGRDGHESKIKNLLSEHDCFLLSKSDAKFIVAAIRNKMSSWRDIFLQSGVLSRDIELLQKYILSDAIFKNEAIQLLPTLNF